jgi:hypothetical protein
MLLPPSTSTVPGEDLPINAVVLDVHVVGSAGTTSPDHVTAPSAVVAGHAKSGNSANFTNNQNTVLESFFTSHLLSHER